MFYQIIYTFITITDTVPTIGFNCEKVVKKSKVSNDIFVKKVTFN
jgi:hypothetical protein